MHSGGIIARFSIVGGFGVGSLVVLQMQVCFKMCLTFVCFFKGIHRRKQKLPKRRLGNMFTYDPISPVAMEISSETCLLCFDEFQVRKRVTHTECLFALAFVKFSKYTNAGHSGLQSSLLCFIRMKLCCKFLSFFSFFVFTNVKIFSVYLVIYW